MQRWGAAAPTAAATACRTPATAHSRRRCAFETATGAHPGRTAARVPLGLLTSHRFAWRTAAPSTAGDRWARATRTARPLARAERRRERPALAVGAAALRAASAAE